MQNINILDPSFLQTHPTLMPWLQHMQNTGHSLEQIQMCLQRLQQQPQHQQNQVIPHPQQQMPVSPQQQPVSLTIEQAQQQQKLQMAQYIVEACTGQVTIEQVMAMTFEKVQELYHQIIAKLNSVSNQTNSTPIAPMRSNNINNTNNNYNNTNVNGGGGNNSGGKITPFDNENPIDILLVLLQQYPQIEQWLKSMEYYESVRTSRKYAADFLTALMESQPQFTHLIKLIQQRLKQQRLTGGDINQSQHQLITAVHNTKWKENNNAFSDVTSHAEKELNVHTVRKHNNYHNVNANVGCLQPPDKRRIVPDLEPMDRKNVKCNNDKKKHGHIINIRDIKSREKSTRNISTTTTHNIHENSNINTNTNSNMDKNVNGKRNNNAMNINITVNSSSLEKRTYTNCMDNDEMEMPPKKKRKIDEKKNKLDWNLEECAEWVASLGTKYKVYMTEFRDNGITGAFLDDLDDETLADIVCNKLHRKKILFEWKNL